LSKFYHADPEKAYREDRLLLDLIYKEYKESRAEVKKISDRYTLLDMMVVLPISKCISDKNFRTLSRTSDEIS